MKKPTLTVIGQVPQPRSDLKPPRPLGVHGAANWAAIQGDLGIRDSGGTELLMQICLAIDRLDQVAALIAQDGLMIRSRGGCEPIPCCEKNWRCAVSSSEDCSLGVTRSPSR